LSRDKVGVLLFGRLHIYDVKRQKLAGNPELPLQLRQRLAVRANEQKINILSDAAQGRTEHVGVELIQRATAAQEMRGDLSRAHHAVIRRSFSSSHFITSHPS